MAQMSLEELYRGEGVGEKYGIMGEVMKDFLQNGRPAEYDERTWLDILLVKHALIAAEKMKSEGGTVSGITNSAAPARNTYLESAKRNGKSVIRRNCQTANVKSLISTPTPVKNARKNSPR